MFPLETAGMVPRLSALAVIAAALTTAVPASASEIGAETLSAAVPAIGGSQPLPIVAMAEPDPRLDWHWTPLGPNIGLSGISIADLDGVGESEIVAASTSYWYVLSLSGGLYEQVWSSPPYQERIRAVRGLGIGHPVGPGVLVALETQVLFYDATAGFAFSGGFTTEASFIVDLEVGDVDADGEVEIVLCDPDDLFIYDLATATLEVQKFGFGCSGIALGQTDTDNQLEIGVTEHNFGAAYVLDGSSLAIEWERPAGSLRLIELADLSGDSRDELAVYFPPNIAVFDVPTDTELYSVATPQVTALRWGDVDGNGAIELLYGDKTYYLSEGYRVHILEGHTGVELWTAGFDQAGVSDIAVGDVDGDGVQEILWGAGTSSSAPDFLYMADASSETIEWQSDLLKGPADSFGHGDIDADGEPELLWAVYNGPYLIHDASTREAEYASQALNGNLRSARAANIDADPQLEVCLSWNPGYLNGRIACYDGFTHAEEWQVPSPAGMEFRSLEIADVDGDGALEILAGTEPSSVRAYEASSGLLEWESPAFAGVGGPNWFGVGDLDADPFPDIAVGFGAELAVLDGRDGSIDLAPVDVDVTSLEIADRDGVGGDELYGGTASGSIQRFDPATGAVLETLANFDGGVGSVLGLTVAEVTGASQDKDFVFVTDGRLTVLDGTSLEVAWQTGHWDLSAGENGILIADVDDDGFREILLNTWVGVAMFEMPGPATFAEGFESGQPADWSEVVGLLAGFLEINAAAALDGSLGLAAEVGGICGAPQDLIIDSPETIEGPFVGCNSITASGVEVGVLGATFAAGTVTSLGNGFSVPFGSPFSASLGSGLLSGLAYLATATPSSKYTYNASFQLNLDNLSMGVLDRVELFGGYSNAVGPEFVVSATRLGGSPDPSLVLSVRQDDGTFVDTLAGDEIPLTTGWNEIRIRWLSGNGTNPFLPRTGALTASVNGAPHEGLEGIENYLQRLDQIRLGYFGGEPIATTGVIYFDSFQSWW